MDNIGTTNIGGVLAYEKSVWLLNSPHYIIVHNRYPEQHPHDKGLVC